jgi:hypothetical protein
LLSRFASWLTETWKVLAAVVGICTAATALNVRVHKLAQAEISSTVEASVRRAVTEAISDKLATVNSRLDRHDDELNTLHQNDGSLQIQLTWLATTTAGRK